MWKAGELMLCWEFHSPPQHNIQSQKYALRHITVTAQSKQLFALALA
jgi:hypothetical protein